MSLWGRIFAAGYDRCLAGTERAGLRDLRRELLAGASGRTLELGSGTGVNVDLYPPTVTELICSEPEEPMARRLRAKHPQVTVVGASAQALPFDDAAFDTVVATLVLCTVPDPAGALAEAARVLRPGGRLLFLEHVRSSDAGLARWQDRWNPFQNRIGHGCHCNRDTGALLAASPLTVERLDTGRLPKAPALLAPLIRGSAVAP